MKRTLFATTLLVTTLTGCSLLTVKGIPGTEPAPLQEAEATNTATPAASASPMASSAASASASATAEAPQIKKGDEDSDRWLGDEARMRDEIEKKGSLGVKRAIEGFSPEALRERIKKQYQGYGEQVSEDRLALVDKEKQAQKDAVASGKKGVIPEVGSRDAAAEKAINADFLKWHAGADIKKVILTDSDWRVNYNGLRTRNRYKNAVVLIGIKDTEVCLSVPANAAQDATQSGFDKQFKHDVFDRGTLVPCK